MQSIKPLTLICVQPCTKYYAWQVEVMLNNFNELGIQNEFQVHCLFAIPKEEKGRDEFVSYIKKVEAAYEEVANFYYYPDTREYPIHYISSVRPNILKQHFKSHPELSQTSVFYHDCDIIFSKFPDFFNKLLEQDNIWYVSDTISYIGYNYIISKGHDILDKMCQIVGAHPFFIKNRESQSGGAQYLMKGVDWRYFEKVEQDCEKMFKDITALNNQKKFINPDYHELQIWCADMWAVSWNAWLRGYETRIIPEMDFCWATDNVEKFQEKYIFHNAGVTDRVKDKIFYKSSFHNSLPYETEANYDESKAGIKYWELIKKIGINSCLC